MENEIIDYKTFLEELNLQDDKVSSLLYDLYTYQKQEDKKEKEVNEGQA